MKRNNIVLTVLMIISVITLIFSLSSRSGSVDYKSPMDTNDDIRYVGIKLDSIFCKETVNDVKSWVDRGNKELVFAIYTPRFGCSLCNESLLQNLLKSPANDMIVFLDDTNERIKLIFNSDVHQKIKFIEVGALNKKFRYFEQFEGQTSLFIFNNKLKLLNYSYYDYKDQSVYGDFLNCFCRLKE